VTFIQNDTNQLISLSLSMHLESLYWITSIKPFWAMWLFIL